MRLKKIKTKNVNITVGLNMSNNWTLKIENSLPVHRYDIVDNENTQICTLNSYLKNRVDYSHLISAAPDMFNALELILNDNKLMNAMNKEQARAILDSVKKAKGL